MISLLRWSNRDILSLAFLASSSFLQSAWLWLSSLMFPSDSDKEVARGEIAALLLLIESWRRDLEVGVLSNVEFTIFPLESLSLLDLVLKDGASIELF